MEKIKLGKHNGELTAECPKCKVPYEDAAVGDVKNYPDDGGFAVFMTCEKCDTEAEAIFNWRDKV